LGSAAYQNTSSFLSPSGNGGSLTGLTQSQISGLTTGSTPTFAKETLTGGLYMPNMTGIYWKDSGGTFRAGIYLSIDNFMVIGDDTNISGTIVNVAGAPCTLYFVAGSTLGCH
jgi:hypothetical protein